MHLNRFGLEANQPAQVVLVPGRGQPLVGNAHLEGSVLPKQVVGNALEDGHVVSGLARPNAAVVLAEGHVQNPVVGVFAPRGYLPMLAHRL